MYENNYWYLLLVLFLWTCNQENQETATINKVKEISKIHQRVLDHSLDSNYIYLKQAEVLLQSTVLASDSLKAENDYLLGRYFMQEGHKDSAAIYFHSSTEYVQDYVQSTRQRDYFYATWDAYISQGKYGDCLTISNRFRSLLQEKNNYRLLALAYYFDENVYMKIPNYNKALDNNQRRIEMLELASDTLNIVSALISQARIKYHYLKDKKGTFAILDELLETSDNLPVNYKRRLYGDYGVYAFYENWYERALTYYLKGLSFAKQTEEAPVKKSLLATGYLNIAEVYVELQEYGKAKDYLDSVKVLGINNIRRDLQEGALRSQLQLAVLTNNNVKEVFSYLDTISNDQERHYAEKFNKELVALTKANEKEKVLLAEKQLTEIKNIKLQSRFFLLLALLSLLTIAGILFYRQRRFRFEKESMELQQRLLRSQMNPHFTFNILYAIQTLIKDNQKAAVNYLLKFSRLLRLILENSMLNYVQLDKELESLTKYMELQLLRFPDKFTYDIVLKDIEEDDFVFIPPMLLQPIVENCIEHGFAGISYCGNITITLSREAQFLSCTIEDNGIGITEKQQEENRSVSTKLIAAFLEKVTKTKMEVINKNDLAGEQTGVVVKFLIPFKTDDND